MSIQDATRRRLTLAFLTIGAVCLLLVPNAQAHEIPELEAWEKDWLARVVGQGLTIELMAERLDMRDRHLWHFAIDTNPPARFAPAAPTGTHADSPAAGGPGAGSGVGSNVEQWRGLVAAHFPADQVDKALRVMACESGGNPSADNPRSSARGLFQILASLWAPHYGVSAEALYDPTLNTRLAADIWHNYGWGAWSCA